MDDRTIREIRLIEFLHVNLWILAFYSGLFLVSLCWMEQRRYPRWTVWVAFALLALPFVAYLRACFHISGKIITLG